MNLLVFGGSYFLGLAFVEQAYRAGHTITVLNRGTHPLGSSRIREFHLDRHDAKALAALPAEHYDTVVDFCGYSSGDIRLIFENAAFSFDQYIFVSTCDVYRRGSGELLREDAPYETRDFGGEAGAYILGKVALEQELDKCVKERCEAQPELAQTVIRPAFIYGPGNYAPREGIYFQWIRQAGQILHPVDASGSFQLVYVEDVAKAILLCCGNPKAYNNAYNLCPPERITYESWATVLAEVADPFDRVDITVSQILEKGIPLPFPLTDAESEKYDGSVITELGLSYTPLRDGLRETWKQS